MNPLPHQRVLGLQSAYRDRLNAVYRLFESLNYNSVLSRGYAVIRDADDKPVSGIKKVRTGEALSIQMSDGRLSVVAGKQQARPKAGRETAGRLGNKQQGDLF